MIVTVALDDKAVANDPLTRTLYVVDEARFEMVRLDVVAPEYVELSEIFVNVAPTSACH